MENKYHLLLEDFEASNSLSLSEVSAQHIPREKELLHFEAGELLQEDDCTAHKDAKKVMGFFNGDYTVVDVRNEVLNEQNRAASRINVTVRLKTKLTLS